MGGKVSNSLSIYLFGIKPKNLCSGMNYQNLLNKLDSTTNLMDRKYLLDNWFYSINTFTERKINLDKNHTAINPKVCINTQQDYDHYMSVLVYLRNLLETNIVRPKWLISFHYSNDCDYIKPIKETDNLMGHKDRYGYKCFGDLWKQSYNNKKRENIDSTYKDARQIKNIVLKYLYNIKRLNQTWKYNYPNILFFHEKGKVKLQYHTHLVIPETTYTNSQEELIHTFNTAVRERSKCISKWKKIDVTEIEPDDKYSVIGYLNKETTSNHLSFDPINSIVPVNT
tara:strand:+ start:114 stop:962 length:849 start_codon:yes stop_codon:yes gene_type:complete